MPPKRKEGTPASGPKQKRSKTSFRTPTTAALEGTTSATSEVGSTSTSSKNRVVTLRASASGRRGYRSQDLSTTQSSSHDSLAADNSSIPSEITGESDIADTSDPSHPPLDPESDSQPGSGAKSKPKKKNTTTTKLNEWLSYRQTCLDELLRHDGLGSSFGQEGCWSCKRSSDACWKCLDCNDGGLLRCQKCIVTVHSCHAFHRIERWNGSFFEKSSLHDSGLRIQLGHGGGTCISPTPGPIAFTVVDVSGIHKVAIDFCDCRTNGIVPHHIQLLRAGWFPATFVRPQTAFTFHCLDFYHELTLQSKVNAYDFCRSLLRLTDSLELNKTSDHLTEFHRVNRIWRHLLMLKRSGRGRDPEGAAATSQGELAIECPACPHPDRNLPLDWKSGGPQEYIYTQFLAVDGNFKLRLKDRGINDPELAPGWAYFVEEEKYQEFIKDYVDQPEINTCRSEHDALVRAAVRCTPGYKVTGTILVLCPRHGLVRKNGVGDLQKGEKYCNIDYVVLSQAKGIRVVRIVLTFDVNCQYSKHFWERMKEFPLEMWIDEETVIEFAIPSWHINAHGADCRADFGLSFRDGVGRTCGEEVEVAWAGTNPLGPSTREMGPGARHETLNGQWGGLNFRRILNFRHEFRRHLKEALEMRKKHTQLFEQFSATFQPNTIVSWEKLINTWKKDRSQPNPYLEPSPSTTLQDVRLELAKEDTRLVALGELSTHKTSLTSFLITGLDLEEHQRTLLYEIKVIKKYETQKQLADLEEKRRILISRINKWREVQLAYIPNLGTLVANTASKLLSQSLTAEDVPLFLPSSLSPDLRNTPAISKTLAHETRLRIAQADDALADIRHHLRIIAGLWQFKKVNISGTGNRPNTRMRSLFNRFNHRMRQSVLRYRAARSALLAAKLPVEGQHWEDRLNDLKDTDVRGPGKDDFYLQEPGKANYGASKGRYEMSWIWLVPQSKLEADSSTSEQVFDEGLRVEWSKSQARKMRWVEEVEILQEEMRRTIVYYEWKQQWWLEQNPRRPNLDDTIQHGISAYSQKQAYYCKCMAERFAMDWLPFLQSEGIKPEWEDRYKRLISGEFRSTIELDVEKEMSEDGSYEGEIEEGEKYDAFELDD